MFIDLDPVGEVVDDVGDEDAEAGGELEELVHGAADLEGRDLGQVERHSLVAEADADAEEELAWLLLLLLQV